MGAIGSVFPTMDPEIQNEISTLADRILYWIMEILQEGKSKGDFRFQADVRVKSLQIISTMLAGVQLARLTDPTDLQQIQENIINDITGQL